MILPDICVNCGKKADVIIGSVLYCARCALILLKKQVDK